MYTYHICKINYFIRFECISVIECSNHNLLFSSVIIIVENQQFSYNFNNTIIVDKISLAFCDQFIM